MKMNNNEKEIKWFASADRWLEVLEDSSDLMDMHMREDGSFKSEIDESNCTDTLMKKFDLTLEDAKEMISEVQEYRSEYYPINKKEK
jgi:hypothetical protein